MSFASKDEEGRLLDIGSRIQKFAVSSSLGELDSLVWVCTLTKTFRGILALVERTDSYALIEEWRSQSLYDSDIRVFHRWGWLMANEPDIQFLRSCWDQKHKGGLVSGRGVKDTLRPIPKVHQISLWDEIWAEQMKGHWVARKTLLAIWKMGSHASWKMVRQVHKLRKVCAKFRYRRANAPFGQLFFSLELGHTIFGDIIGPLTRCKGGAWYIHYLIDSATRLGDAMKKRATSILRALGQWVRNGLFKVLC